MVFGALVGTRNMPLVKGACISALIRTVLTPIYRSYKTGFREMASRHDFKNYHAILRYDNPDHHEYRGYEINLGNGKAGYSDSYREIMEKLILSLENSLDYFNSIYVLRFDLMFDDLGRTSSNSASRSADAQRAINWFCEGVKRYLFTGVTKPRDARKKPLRNHTAVSLNWVREYSRNKGYHYHCYIILDARKIAIIGEPSNSIVSLRSLLEYYWVKAVTRAVDASDLSAKPYVHINSGRKRASYVIRTNSKDRGDKAIRRAVSHLSYLAKVRGKLYHSKHNGALHTHSIALLPSINKAL